MSLTLEKKPLDLLQNYESVLRGILFSCTSANILSGISLNRKEQFQLITSIILFRQFSIFVACVIRRVKSSRRVEN